MQKVSTSFYITEAHKAFVDRMLESGRFRTAASVLDYSMRFMLDNILRNPQIKIRHQIREANVKLCMRADPWVMEGLTNKGRLKRSEVADYALQFYSDWLKKGPKRG